jgi:VIT1/CCC1 family predicted Fe2+/Mn2+ transporter
MPHLKTSPPKTNQLTAAQCSVAFDEPALSSGDLTTQQVRCSHLRDELGISHTVSARPVPAAFASAGTFTVGAALPLLLVLIVPASTLVWVVSGGSLFFLTLLGALPAHAGGAPIWKSVARVSFWCALAMALTAGVGVVFGAKL